MTNFFANCAVPKFKKKKTGEGAGGGGGSLNLFPQKWCQFFFTRSIFHKKVGVVKTDV